MQRSTITKIDVTGEMGCYPQAALASAHVARRLSFAFIDESGFHRKRAELLREFGGLH
jgi:hypothetical protein